MRTLAAAADKQHKSYRKAFLERFVFLNVYCQSMADEHDPRGPDGPFQFQDRSVPVLVIKTWTGESMVHQLGFQPDPKQGVPELERFVDRAVKANGPIVSPKALRPLLKAHKAGEAALAKGKVPAAIKKFLKVRKGAAKKVFEVVPAVVTKAEARLAELRTRADDEIAAAAALEDPAKSRRAYREVLRTYRNLPGLDEVVTKKLKELR